MVKEAQLIQDSGFQKWLEWGWKKLESALWVIAGVFCLYYSNFFHNMYTHPKVNHLFLYVAWTGAILNLAMIFFVGFILPLMGYKDVEDFNPRLIFVGASTGMISFLAFSVAM